MKCNSISMPHLSSNNKAKSSVENNANLTVENKSNYKHFFGFSKKIPISSFTPKFQKIYLRYLKEKRRKYCPSIVELIAEHKTDKIREMTDTEALKDDIGEEMTKFKSMLNMNRKQKSIVKEGGLDNAGDLYKENRTGLLMSLTKYDRQGKIPSNKKKSDLLAYQDTIQQFDFSSTINSSKSNDKIRRFNSRNTSKEGQFVTVFNTTGSDDKCNRRLNLVYRPIVRPLNPYKMTFKSSISRSDIKSVILNNFLEDKLRKIKIAKLKKEENLLYDSLYNQKLIKKANKFRFLKAALQLGKKKINLYSDCANFRSVNSLKYNSNLINTFNRDWAHYKKIQEYKNPETKYERVPY